MKPHRLFISGILDRRTANALARVLGYPRALCIPAEEVPFATTRYAFEGVLPIAVLGRFLDPDEIPPHSRSIWVIESERDTLGVVLPGLPDMPRNFMRSLADERADDLASRKRFSKSGKKPIAKRGHLR